MIIVKSKGIKVEYMLKEFRQKTRDTKLLQELKDRRHHTKKSVKRREEIKQAKYNERSNRI